MNGTNISHVHVPTTGPSMAYRGSLLSAIVGPGKYYIHIHISLDVDFVYLIIKVVIVVGQDRREIDCHFLKVVFDIMNKLLLGRSMAY